MANSAQTIIKQISIHEHAKLSAKITLIRAAQATDTTRFISFGDVLVATAPLIAILTIFSFGVSSVVLCTVFVPMLWVNLLVTGAIQLVCHTDPEWHRLRTVMSSFLFSVLMIFGVCSTVPLLDEAFDFAEAWHTTQMSSTSLRHGAVLMVGGAAFSMNLLVGMHCYATRQIDTLATEGSG